MFLSGEKLEGGHYTVIKELGQGGMGVVYHCHDEFLQRDVAIKMLLPELTTNKETLEGFIQEARLAAALEHPNVVTIYEIGKEEQQNKTRHYMVMEYLTGGNLASRINGQPLALEHCLNWMKQLANGLSFAHKRGIVHQDIKADNIFITTEGDLKIGDFGLARLAAGRARGRSGHRGMGTPAYMSPELCRGDHQDQRSDIYSMGILFFEMATGQLPYKARGMIEMAMKHTSAPIPVARRFNPLIPDVLNKVILKMMAKQPEERYQSMADVLSILDDLIFELRAARLGLAPKAAAGAGASSFFQTHAGGAGVNDMIPPAVQGTGGTPAQESPATTERAEYREAAAAQAAPESAAAKPSPEAAVVPKAVPAKHLELLWAFHSYGPIGWRALPVHNKEETMIFCPSADGTCYALDARVGSKIWAFETGGPVVASPAVAGDNVFLAGTDGHVYALAADAGSLAWKSDMASPIVCPASAFQNLLFVGTTGGELLALSAASGSIKWRYKTGQSIVSRAEIVNPTVFSASKDGYVHALDLASGSLLWKFQAGSPLVAGLVASADSIYTSCLDGSFYALDIDSGRLIWQYDTSKPILSRALIHFTTVIFCSQDRWLYCCEKYDGHLLWKAPVRGRVVANLVAFNDLIYVVTREGWVQCFEARNGTLKWQMETKKQLEAAPYVRNDMLCLGTVDGDILAYSLAQNTVSRTA